MGYKDREIEWKLLTDGFVSIAPVEKIITQLLLDVNNGDRGCRPTIIGCASDTYWSAPEESPADFVRLRVLDDTDEHGNPAQITLKASDRGGNVNRVEVDLGVSDHSQANKLLTMMLGDPLGQVTKRYTVFFLEDVHTTISIYKIVRDKRVFVEVEARTLKRVKEITRILVERGGLCFTRIPQSLYDMFVLKKEMTPEPLPPLK